MAMVCLPVLACAGCFVEQGPRAQSTTVELDEQQRHRARAIMVEAVDPVPAAGQPLMLVARGTMRWSDLPHGVGLAGKRPGVSLAIVDSDIGSEVATFQMVSPEGWPILLSAENQGDLVVFHAVVGPYPEATRAQAMARRLEREADKAMRVLSRRPWLPDDG